MDYKIAYSETTEGLQNKIKTLLAEGWQLQGGVFVERYFDNASSKNRFYQALTKEEAQ